MADETTKPPIETVEQAIDALLDEFHLGDYIYDVRARECKGWHGPQVTRFQECVTILTERKKRD